MHSQTELSYRQRADAYIDAAHTLRAHDIPPLLMRDSVASLNTLSEVDVLVPQSRLDSAVKALVEKGWEIYDSGLFHPCKRSVVLFVEGELLKLDLHGRLVDNGLVYLPNAALFERAKLSDTGFLIPDDEGWTVHVLLHVILGKTTVPEKLRAGLEQRHGNGLDRGRMRNMAASYGLDKILDAAFDGIVEKRRYDDSALIAGLKRRARLRLHRSPGNLCRSAWLAVVWPVGQALGWRPGLLIAFIGPDGVGKSSMIEALSAAFAKLQIPTRNAYLGPWDRPLLPSAKLLRAIGAGHCDYVLDMDADTPAAVRIKKHLAAFVKRTAYYGNLLLEIWARHLYRVWPHLALRRVVLGDRYVYDLHIGHFNTEIRSWKGVRHAIVALSPRPHLVIFLDNDAETVWARKKEYPLETIRSVLYRYRVVAKRYGAVTMRTDVPPNAAAEAFLNHYWRTIIRARRDRIRVWF